MSLMPKQGENVKWYQMPAAIIVGLYRLFVKRERVDE